MSSNSEARSKRPSAQEHAPYYGSYIARVADGDIVATLATQMNDSMTMLRPLSEAQAGKRYAEGKWSVREVIGHMIDTERVFTYRALRFSRNDDTPLPGYDEGLFVANSSLDQRTVASLCDEFDAVRHSSIHFFNALLPAEWDRKGTANNAAMTVRAIAWICAGHELHHRALIAERYL